MVEQPTRLAPGHRYLPKEDAAKLASEWAAEERRNNPSPPPPPRPKPPTPLTPAEKAARRRRERERAAAEKELGRQRLIQQIEFKEQRRKAQVLYKEAQEAKRQHEAWDPTPVARAMYDDQELRARAAIPGPGSYTPKSEPGIRLTVGRTIGGVGVDFESKTRSPGPAAYLPVHVPPPSGSTFGLPPKLRKGRFKGGEVPSAHDIGYMVDHLRDLPAPGHYHPRNHLARNRGFYMHRPKQASATSPSSTTPGPGTYNTAGNMIGKAPKFSGAGGKTSLDQAIHQVRACSERSN